MNGAPAEPDSVPPVLGAPGASPLEGAPVAPLERTPAAPRAAPAPRTRHWLPAAVARGLALFAGVFALLSAVGAARVEPVDGYGWWVVAYFVPRFVSGALLAAVGVAFVAYAVAPRMAAWRRWPTLALFAFFVAVAVYNAVAFYVQWRGGRIAPSVPLSSSLVAAGLLAFVTWAAAPLHVEGDGVVDGHGDEEGEQREGQPASPGGHARGHRVRHEDDADGREESAAHEPGHEVRDDPPAVAVHGLDARRTHGAEQREDPGEQGQPAGNGGGQPVTGPGRRRGARRGGRTLERRDGRALEGRRAGRAKDRRDGVWLGWGPVHAADCITRRASRGRPPLRAPSLRVRLAAVAPRVLLVDEEAGDAVAEARLGLERVDVVADPVVERGRRFAGELRVRVGDEVGLAVAPGTQVAENADLELLRGHAALLEHHLGELVLRHVVVADLAPQHPREHVADVVQVERRGSGELVVLPLVAVAEDDRPRGKGHILGRDEADLAVARHAHDAVELERLGVPQQRSLHDGVR